MKEIWKPIQGFEKYEVSNTGKVRSIDRIVFNKGSNRQYKVRGKELIPQPNAKTGRVYVNLYDEDNKRTNRMIPRIVAETFIPNPDNLEEVNHIDRDVKNNAVSNLEWVSPKENMKHLEDNYSFDFGRVAVTGTNIKTGEVVSFNTLKEASEYLTVARGKKSYPSAISNAVNGIIKSAYGCYWEQSNLETIESIAYCREDN